VKLKDWLRSNKVSQASLGAKVGITQVTVSRICKGDYPGAETMYRIALATGGSVQPNDFFDGLPASPTEAKPVTVRVSFNGRDINATARAA
jgi:transcriptional regulator with XRE-family HTH domain